MILLLLNVWSDIIRTNVNGYLKNITEKDELKFDCKGIKNKDKLIFSFDDVKYSIKYGKDTIILVREGKDFVNNFIFNNRKSKVTYLLKDNNYEIELDIKTNYINIDDTGILINYEILDTNCLYEFKLEIGDVK